MDTTTTTPAYGIRRQGSTVIARRTVYVESAWAEAAHIARGQAHTWEIVNLTSGRVVADVDRHGNLHYR